MPTVEELKSQLFEAEVAAKQAALVAAQTNLPGSAPAPAQAEVPSDPYAPKVWLSNTFDFLTPSGQLCQLKKVDVAQLAEKGILDKLTRLPGIAAAQVAKAEGAPPEKAVDPELPDTETIKAVLEAVNVLVPLVVVQPHVWELPAEGEPRVPERIYVDSIEIGDRIAIMHRVLGGLQDLDKFRQQS